MVTFSEDDLAILQNQEFILKKKALQKRIFKQLTEIHQTLGKLPIPHRIRDYYSVSGKVSKGENYQNLPYLVLDYPRHFTQDSTLAFRTIIWWGNYIIFNLLLDGPPAQLVSVNHLASLRSEWKLNFGNDPWQHALSNDDQAFTAADLRKRIEAPTFIKLSKAVPLHEIDNLEQLTLQHYHQLIGAAFE